MFASFCSDFGSVKRIQPHMFWVSLAARPSSLQETDFLDFQGEGYSESFADEMVASWVYHSDLSGSGNRIFPAPPHVVMCLR
jgi:hypothetical protein